jgi:rubredoxin
MNAHDAAVHLRDIADLLDKMPQDVEIRTHGNRVDIWCDTKEQMVALTRGTGPWEKKADGSLYILSHYLPSGAQIDLNITRDKVCRRIERTVTVPATPERTITIEAKEEHQKIEVEWECPDSLLDKKDPVEMRAEVAAAETEGG